ncbi:MAG: hypothetical protein A2V66_09750 [Ignavibacteria bacterium RBG_13_36_8]|nr:MAG: hypothetical protein A2V66_09750 [Ignavibacteria bacterium RBG_13_36_8]
MLVWISFVTAQRPTRPIFTDEDQGIPDLIFFETHVLPHDSLFECYITFRIPYNNLVFIKDNGFYKGGLSLTIEALLDESVTAREIASREVTVENYEITKSRNEFIEGLLKINLERRIYTFSPSITIGNTDQVIVLKPFTCNIDKEINGKIIKPIVVAENISMCQETELFELVNYQNYIPFSSSHFSLVIPITDTSIDSINVEVMQENNVTSYSLSAGHYSIAAGFNSCDNKIIIAEVEGNAPLNLFVLNDINKNLKEGITEISVGLNGKEKKTFTYNVVWLDKPKSLMDTEYAIKLLGNIVNESVVDELLDHSRQDYYKYLYSFWEKRNSRKDSFFNGLMEEFYTRVDYANENFSTLDGFGASLDRGKIYIKFGKPTKVERLYSEKSEVIEIWHYSNINRDFYFKDNTGLGNFSLIK